MTYSTHKKIFFHAIIKYFSWLGGRPACRIFTLYPKCDKLCRALHVCIAIKMGHT